MNFTSLACRMARRSRRRLPARVEAIRALRQLVERCAQRAGLAQDEVALFVVACVEAFTNVVRHGQGRPPGTPIELVIRCEDDALIVELVHLGDAFHLPRATAPWELERYPESGLGLFIMRAAASEVEHVHEGGFNTVRLTHRPAAARA